MLQLHPSAMPIAVKRIYDGPSPDDGHRVLVDRLWPRGLSKQDARLDRWLKEIAPSTELREWLHADRSRWEEFKARYLEELGEHLEALGDLAERARTGQVTLLYGSRDTERNHAVVLREVLEGLGES
jgi:uncharacterized protein YeaO (DUF488 family)